MLWAIPALLLGAGQAAGCEPASEVRAALERVQAMRAGAGSNDWVEAARAELRAALARRPDDIAGNLEYLALHRSRGHDEVIARYRAALEAHGGDRRYELFYAASLIGTDTPEALRRLRGLAAGGYVYAHLPLGQIHSYPRFEDKAALTGSLSRFVAACPGYLSAYELLSQAGTGEAVGLAAARLRAALEGRSGPAAVAAYRWLWPMEFRATPVAGHGALREQVARDLARLGLAVPQGADPLAAATLRVAYRLRGDSEALKQLPMLRNAGDEMMETESRWYEEHRRPAPDAPRPQRDAYNGGLAEAAGHWAARWPGEVMPLRARFRALAAMEATSEVELEAAGAALIEAAGRRPGRLLSEPAAILVAREFVRRGGAADRIAALIEQGLAEAASARPYPESDLFDDRNQRMNASYRAAARAAAYGVRFDWAIRRAELEVAREALAAMKTAVDLMAAQGDAAFSINSVEVGYWTKAAEMAEREGRGVEADEARRAAASLSRASQRQRLSQSSKAEGRTLPPFDLAGLDGRRWTARELEGKAAVVSVWATWCRPCLSELAELQRLSDEWKGRGDVVAVSLNVDANPGLAAPVVARNGWRFPVLLAFDYVGALLPDLSLPRTWIVVGGQVRAESAGFGGAAAWRAWIDEQLKRVLGAQPNQE